jgi:hypothetical protein
MPRIGKQAPLVTFAFESHLCAMDRQSIDRLVRQVWRDNVAHGITGEMCLDGTCVRQVVEGRVDTVLPLVARILSDRRHSGIRIMALEALANRRFACWSVQGLPETPITSIEEISLSAAQDARVVPFPRFNVAPAASGCARRLA